MKKKLLPIVLLMITISCSNSANNKINEDRTLEPNTTQKAVIKDTVVFDCDYIGEIPPGNEPKLFAPNIISTGDLGYPYKVGHS